MNYCTFGVKSLYHVHQLLHLFHRMLWPLVLKPVFNRVSRWNTPKKMQRFQRISEILYYLASEIAWRHDTSPIDRGKIIQSSIAKENSSTHLIRYDKGKTAEKNIYIRNKEI